MTKQSINALPAERIGDTNKKYKPLLYRGQRLHSVYNPYREAEIILKQQVGSVEPHAIIIIEPGEGYIVERARQHFPHTALLAVHIDTTLYQHCRWKADVVWHPSSSLPLEEICTTFIESSLTPRLAIVIPPVIQRIAPQEVISLQKKLTPIINRIRADMATVGNFGRAWITDSIVNFLSVEKIARLPPSNTPVCIVGSGASVEEQLDTLRHLNTQVAIWALPSALATLLKHEITPEVVVTTDGGYWASWHYRSATPLPEKMLWAMPLSAARGIYRQHTALTLFQQGFALERELACWLWPHTYSLPPCGTVAGSALMLAAAVGARHIILAGVDLSFQNYRLHCTPHSFDSFYSQRIGRLFPAGMVEACRWLQATATDNPAVRIARQHAIYHNMLYALITQLRSKIDISILGYSPWKDELPQYNKRHLETILTHGNQLLHKRSHKDPATGSYHLPPRSARVRFLKKLGQHIAHELRNQSDTKTMRPELREIFFSLSAQKLYQLPHPRNTQFAAEWYNLREKTAQKFEDYIARYVD